MVYPSTLNPGQIVDLVLGDANFRGNGRNATLKLDGQINFMAGINWPF